MAIQTGSTYISDSMRDIPTANLGFSTTPRAKKLTWAIATTTDNRKQHSIDVLDADIAIYSSRSLSQSFGESSVELDIIENPEFGVGI